MTPEGTVNFTRMDEGTPEEYALLSRRFESCYRALPDNVLAMLHRLRGDKLGYKVDRFEHSLQTATRAFRDNADEETVVTALLHDIGDVLAPENHAELAGAVLRPYISEANLWVVRHHGIFQGYYYFHHIGADRNARDKYRGHEHFERCALFCERWDQVSFDPSYDAMPLSAFEPMVRRLFDRKPFAYGN